MSRKALSNAVFDLLKNPLPTINSISSFINSIDIPEDIIKKLPEMGEFDFSEIIDDFPHSVQYQTLLESESFNGIYAGAHKKNKDAFDTYLKKFPFDDCAFVDVGWAGTMQKALSSYLGKKTLGYYLGVNIVNFSDPYLLDQSVTMKGIMFSNYPVKSKYYDCFAGNVPVYELFISALTAGRYHTA